MNTNTLRTLSAAGIVGALFIAASPAWARYGHHYAYGPRYVRPYRPAAVVMVPPVVRYGYAPAPVYYIPRPAYAPAPAYYGSPPVYYGAQAYYRPSMGIGIYAGRRGYSRDYGHR